MIRNIRSARVPQRFHRVHTRGAAGGDKAGERGHGAEQEITEL